MKPLLLRGKMIVEYTSSRPPIPYYIRLGTALSVWVVGLTHFRTFFSSATCSELLIYTASLKDMYILKFGVIVRTVVQPAKRESIRRSRKIPAQSSQPRTGLSVKLCSPYLESGGLAMAPSSPRSSFSARWPQFMSAVCMPAC